MYKRKNVADSSHRKQSQLWTLKSINFKCDRILLDLAEIKSEIRKLPDNIGRLIQSLNQSANEMKRQSEAQLRKAEGGKDRPPYLFFKKDRYEL